MRANVRLLHDLMEALISEWGSDEVVKAFQDVASEFSDQASPVRSEKHHRRPKHTQLTALNLLERSGLPDEKLTPLRQIAERFDAKTFLPSPADIREFLISLGLRPKSFKDRSAAFKLVLEQIAPMPTDALYQIANSSMFSGPARLGPLADAIAEAASSRHSGERN